SSAAGHSRPAIQNFVRIDPMKVRACTRAPCALVIPFCRLRPPLVSRDNAFHEFIEEWNREGGISMAGTPNHALGDKLIARRTKRRYIAAELVGDVSRAMRPRAQLCHGTKVAPLKWRQTIEAHTKEALIKRCD